MIAALKSELRKLWTVRSTYYLFGASLLIACVILGLWAFGYKDAGRATTEHNALLASLYWAVNIAGIFLSFVAILLVGHEYRYNTIMYSLTITNQRFKVFFAKWLAMLGFSLGFAVLSQLLNFVLFRVGQAWHGVHAVTQHVPAWSFAWRAVATVWGDITYAFIVAMLVRSLIGAIAIVLILPSTLENLLALLLHGNIKYLPYTALGRLTDTASTDSLTPLLTVCTYVVVGLLLACLLFQRRDAN
jgi:ABC-type transport system involved in multi-copper enzyme maturation permease subunit